MIDPEYKLGPIGACAGTVTMNPLFSVDLDSKAAYVSYRPSAKIARQVRVVRGRTGRLGAIPFGPALDGMPTVIAEFDDAGDIVGVQIDGITPETLGLADEFLSLLDLALPAPLAHTLFSTTYDVALSV